MDEIETFLCRTLSGLLRLPPESVSAGSDLMADLGADSLDIVELLMAVEKKYGYYLPDSDLIRMRTVGDLAQNIRDALSESGKQIPL